MAYFHEDKKDFLTLAGLYNHLHRCKFTCIISSSLNLFVVNRLAIHCIKKKQHRGSIDLGRQTGDRKQGLEIGHPDLAVPYMYFSRN